MIYLNNFEKFNMTLEKYNTNIDLPNLVSFKPFDWDSSFFHLNRVILELNNEEFYYYGKECEWIPIEYNEPGKSTKEIVFEQDILFDNELNKREKTNLKKIKIILKKNNIKFKNVYLGL